MKLRPLFQAAECLQTTALLFEGDGRPALYICAQMRSVRHRLYRVPEGCVVTIQAPHPLPPMKDGEPRVFLPTGSKAVFELPGESRTALRLISVRICRELLEAIEAHAHALSAWQAAFKHEEGAA